MSSHSKVVEAYTKFQDPANTTDEAIASHAADFQVLVTSLDQADVPINIRARSLQVIAAHGGKFDASILKKTVAAVVKVISGDDDTPQLLVAAVNAILGLCKTTPAKLADFVIREGSDVLMQVALDEEGFPAQVRAAASAALHELVQTNGFRGVITKLLHWISDDREKEEETQLVRERGYAFTTLRQLVTGAKYAAQWTEEAQQQVLTYMALVFPTVTAREFMLLLRITANLPIVKAASCVPLIDTILGKHKKLDTVRTLESLCLLAPMVPRTVAHKPLVDKVRPLVSQVDMTEKGVWKAKTIAFGATCVGEEEVAQEMLADVLAAVEKMLAADDGIPEYPVALEALLFAVTTLGQKAGQKLLEKLNEDAFNALVTKAQASVATLRSHALFAVKKKAQVREATNDDARMLGCLSNLAGLLGPFATKHLPTTPLVPSWEKLQPLPKVKRVREAAALPQTGAAAPAQKKQRQVYQPPGARKQQQKRGGGGGGGGGGGNKNKRRR